MFPCLSSKSYTSLMCIDLKLPRLVTQFKLLHCYKSLWIWIAINSSHFSRFVLSKLEKDNASCYRVLRNQQPWTWLRNLITRSVFFLCAFDKQKLTTEYCFCTLFPILFGKCQCYCRNLVCRLYRLIWIDNYGHCFLFTIESLITFFSFNFEVRGMKV